MSQPIGHLCASFIRLLFSENESSLFARLVLTTNQTSSHQPLPVRRLCDLPLTTMPTTDTDPARVVTPSATRELFLQSCR
jgi:hypothetical protein